MRVATRAKPGTLLGQYKGREVQFIDERQDPRVNVRGLLVKLGFSAGVKTVDGTYVLAPGTRVIVERPAGPIDYSIV